MRPLPLHSNSPYLSGRGSDIEDDDSEEDDSADERGNWSATRRKIFKYLTAGSEMAVIYGEGRPVRIGENLKDRWQGWGRRSLGRSQKMHDARWTWEMASEPKSGGYFDGDYISLSDLLNLVVRPRSIDSSLRSPLKLSKSWIRIGFRCSKVRKIGGYLETFKQIYLRRLSALSRSADRASSQIVSKNEWSK
jgi:hypothetical protein